MTPPRRRMRMARPQRSAAAVAVFAMAASLLTSGAMVTFGAAAPASAAVSPSQAWVTGVSAVTAGDAAGNGAWRTLTFDTGLTATETTTTVTGRCNPFGTGSAGANNVAAFLEPDPPADVRSADINCAGPYLGGGARTATVEFSKPVIAPVLHAVNLDASRAGISGAGITLTTLAKNNAMEVTGTTLNSTLQQALNSGCAGNDGSNPHGACGSFRLTSAAPVTTFTLTNDTTGSTLPEVGSNDSWSYTLSYPTAPLTKAFNPASITAGGTSALTFTISNPASPTQPTLTPLDFTDQLPAGVTLADDTVAATPGCGSPTVNAAAGATEITASGISVAAGATCEITVNVTSDTVGSYTNDTDNLSTSVANLIPDADTTLTVTEAPESPVPFSCLAGAPGTLFQQAPTDVYSVDLTTGASSEVASDIAASNLNAAGYNPADDFMYAFDQSGSFVRIGSDWAIEDLGLPSNWTTFPVPTALRTALNVGEFDADGHYWVSNSNAAQPGWVEIDLSDPASPTYMQVVSAGSFTMPAGWLQGPDWGYNDEDGDLYATAYMNTVTPVRMALVRFDTDTHTMSLVRDLGPLQNPGGQPVSALFGAVYSDPNGFLYGSDNGTGAIWRFDMGTGAAAFFAQGPASGFNDGARCFNSPLPIEFGDAPNSYGTTLASDGPRHMIVDGIQLGSDVDAEADGQPNAAADGDGADEDGVAFNPALDYPNATIRTGVNANSQQPVENTLEVEASADGFVSVWVDWNQDGDFLDTGEQVANAQPVTTGSNDVTFAQGTNPSGIQTYVRVRYSTNAASIASPTGAAPDGEVEDYRVLVERLVQPDSCVANTVEFSALTFGAPVSEVSNGGAPGTRVRYANVTVVNGVAVDVIGEVESGALNPGVRPPDGFGDFAGAHDDAAWTTGDATIRYSFVEAGTTTPVPINAVITVNDMDAFTADVRERATFDLADLRSYAVTEGSTVAISEAEGKVTFTGTVASDAGPESRFQVVLQGIEAFESRWEGARSSGFSMDGDGDIGIQPPACSDFGDAPNSYGTDLASNGPRHTVTPGLTLGARIDFDSDGQPNAEADGDDSDRLADEDGVSFNPALGYPSATIRTGLDPDSQQPVENTLEVEASADGFVSVWVDWNQDGDFLDTGEQVANAQPVTTGSNDVTFAQGTNPSGIQTYVRVRYSTDAASIASPSGAAPDGEVEDYRVLVERLIQPDSCVTTGSQYYAFTFDNVAATTGIGMVGSSTRFANVSVIQGVPVDMVVEVLEGVMRPDQMPPNGIGRGDGINFGIDDGQWQINTMARLRYSFYEAGTTSPVEISGVFTANDMDGPNVESAAFTASDLAGYAVTEGSAVTIRTTGDDIVFSGGKASFGDPGSRFQVALEDKSSFEILWRGGNGSGFGFDGDGDLTIQPPACSDFGDAPDSYGTTLASNGPRHTITPGLAIGSLIDFDPDGQPTAAADGDDTDRVADEDGVAGDVVVTVGDETTVTVSVTNGTSGAATLAGWIDLNGSGAFDDGELVTAPVPANSGTADYQLTFPVGAVTADTFARFRLFPGEVTTFSPTGAATAGEVEDYPVTVVERELSITKTSDATADSRPGDTITYTVTVQNTGDGDYTTANPAVVLDDLSGVLDDAAFNDDAQASDGPAPTFSSPRLSWAGPLDAGETVTITYSVTLAAGGDGVVRNVAFGPGCDPADPACDTTAPACDPPVGGVDPVTGVPCAATELLLPRLTHTKVADTTELPADGGVVTYTVTVENTGPGVFTAAAPGTMTDDLSAVLDDAAYNDDASADIGTVSFDPADDSLTWEGPLAVGAIATITYSVTYDASAGDNSLVNVACVPAELATDPADPCRSVQIPGSALQDRKSVNPGSGTSVVAGQQVTYTLYFQNTGLATATVDTFDDLSDVLDDATLTGGPTTSNPALSAVVNGTRIDVTGAVPAAATYTVSYTVTVKAFAEQGDHVLGNVLGGDAGCPTADPTCRTENPVRHLAVTKTSDAETDVTTGDVVTYTVTVRNDGEGDYTDDAPAVAQDDLSGVLDDASYNADVSASAGSISYTAPILTWTGPLAAGDAETFTYSVTVTNGGDHVLQNTAAAVCASPEICDPPAIVTTPLPHIVPSKTSDPASGEALQGGDVVTYTLSWTNDGQAAGAVDSSDDLSDVLDDADVTSEPAPSDAAITAERTGDEIRVAGTLQPDQTVTVTYSVTIKPDGERGDNIASNVLTPDVPPYLCQDADADCEPFAPPTTTHPIGELDDWKLVDPASGSTVRPGQQVTYTLHFENTGEADVDVNRDDVLTQVLDDAAVTTGPTSSDPALSVSPISADRFTVSGTLTPGQHVTVMYAVTVNADGDRGDDRLGNALVPTGTDPDGSCVPVDFDRPDCTVNHVSNVVASKSADPASGTEVSPGERVTYTLTFENVSMNPDAASTPIDYTDHLADVVDDANVSAGPVTSDLGVTAERGSQAIRITGAVASGDTVTVTYTVTVKAYDEQGDHRLGNVIAITGEEPTCAPGSNLCTEHVLVSPPDLAITGGTIAWAAVLGALVLLLGGGGALVIARRRRAGAAADIAAD